MGESFARIEGAEIFASGTWNGISFSEEDLDRIVRAFDALELSGKVPLKLGHDGPDAREDPTTQFALGWVMRVWRDGRKLLADLDVPERVFRLIKEGFLKFVSVELLRNVRASNREIPWVLDAVALLGTDPPAVGVLRDLQTLTMARRAAALPHSERVTFSRAGDIPRNNGDRPDMSDETKTTVEQLMEKLIALQSTVADLQQSNADLAIKAAQAAAFKRQIDTMQADLRAEKIRAHRERIKALIEEAVRRDEILPAARERFLRTHRVDDDEAVMALTESDVEQFVEENPNPRKKAKPRAAFTSLAKFSDDVPSGLEVDREGVLRVTAWFRENGITNPTADDWVNGTKAVFAALPEFAERYKANADAIYDGKRG